jgi:PAS domain S-box-containing protein
MNPESLSIFPVRLVDVAGSAVMIALSISCVRHARWLHLRDPQHLIWTYLLWFSWGLLFFSLSRSGGHLIRYFLEAVGLGATWVLIRPVSGSLNTLSFVLVGAITLFSSKVYLAYRQMEDDKAALERAHEEIKRFSADLERIVEGRTRELSASEAKYRRVFEGSKDMLFICDAQGRLRDVNPAGCALLGVGALAEIAGRDLFGEFLSADGGAALRGELRARDFVKDMEVTVRRADGREAVALLSATVRRGAGGQWEGLEGTVKDITLRRDMERQLLQADKLASLGQLSAGVAHEINNPLGLILGYAQLIMREVRPDSQVHTDLKIIEKHAVQCKRIVEDLLKFSRSTGTSKSPVDLNELLREILSVVKGKFLVDRVQVDEHLDARLPRVTADGDKMKQVFMNLIMNARQAITPPGRIVVTTVADPDRGAILASVADTGGGIPAEILDRIFDPFFTTKPTGLGTGLGLSVSYGIVKDHQGEIRVESEPGRGSTFTVLLPAGRAGMTGGGKAS